MSMMLFAKIITAIGQGIAKFIENNLTFSVIVVQCSWKTLNYKCFHAETRLVGC